jgi:hypothetical protein
MKKRRWILTGGLLTALLIVAAVGAQAAFADAATPPAPPDGRGVPPTGAPGEVPGGPHGRRGLGPGELEAAAKALGMAKDDLLAALKDGKTLEDLATTQGVDITVVQDAIKAAHQAQMLADIDQAVTDGKMTQDKADWLILGLQKGYLDGPGFGFGRGMGPGGPQAKQQPAS